MFSVYQTAEHKVHPIEYLPAAAGTYHVGEAVSVSDGKLAILASALTTTPPYICQKNVTAAAGDLVPVIRVDKGTVFETELSASSSGAKIGAKLQIAAGGLKVNSAATGTFELVYAKGTASGDMVRGRFN